MARASGLSSITLFTAGPRRSISSIRARYFSVREREVNFPDCHPSLEIRDGELVEFGTAQLREQLAH